MLLRQKVIEKYTCQLKKKNMYIHRPLKEKKKKERDKPLFYFIYVLLMTSNILSLHI